MKIDLTKNEYGVLLDLLFLADWVMHAHATEEEEHHPEHEALKKKIYSHFKEMEAEDKIEFSEELDNYLELANYEEELHTKFIEPYDDNNFWVELIDRLAERDVISNVGIERFNKLQGNDRLHLIEEAKERYENEFAKNGLKHLKIHKTSPKSNKNRS